VRSVAECLSESAADVTVQTSLLEARLLCGSPALFARLLPGQYGAQMDPHAFLVAKTLEMRQRHTKYENTPYALEPNCKESPGGLRDLQLILWVAKAAGLGKQLARAGRTAAWPHRLRCARSSATRPCCCLIRARLHAMAGRREDRLVFDLQTAVAESFGYRSQAPDGRACHARQRDADAPLLLGGQGRHAAQPDPAAQHRRAAEPQPMSPAPSTRAFLTRPA
jgi:[protein-PII] uridylyltransferase